jgi:hypothetical protein
VGHRGGAGQGKGGRGAPERWVNGGATQTASGGGVTPVVVDEGGWVLQLEGDPGVRRRRSIEGKEQLRGVLTGRGGRWRRSDGVRRGGGALTVEYR